jgi:phenylalanine-4-hydroxylase
VLRIGWRGEVDGDKAKSVKPNLVDLDRDHPGFRDPVYRQRRDAIAALALAHRPGEPPPDVGYTPDEIGVWATVLDHLAPLHRSRACPQYLEAAPGFDFQFDHVPSFAELGAYLQPRTGFRLEPVAGLVTPREFMARLGDGVFLATQYMRHASTPLYTPEPDVVHEVIGHAPLLAHPTFASLNRSFGEATARADEARLLELIRVYWYVLEFGVYEAPDGLRVVGAGLLSSFGELGGFRDRADLRPFDIDAIAATPFDPTDYQGILFVAPSLDGLLGDLRGFLDRA